MYVYISVLVRVYKCTICHVQIHVYTMLGVFSFNTIDLYLCNMCKFPYYLLQVQRVRSPTHLRNRQQQLLL